MKSWIYRGVLVLPADRNAAGIRWCARMGLGYCLRTETKQQMRRMIAKALFEEGNRCQS